jgi:hypothetical protein
MGRAYPHPGARETGQSADIDFHWSQE